MTTQADWHAAASVLAASDWLQMPMVDAGPVDAQIATGTGAVDRMAEMVQHQPGGNRSILALPGENVGTNLKSSPDSELAVPLDQMIGPEDAIGILATPGLSIESLIYAGVGVVLDRSIHRQAKRPATQVCLAVAVAFMVASTVRNFTCPLHGTEGITSANLDKEHAP